jgi:hypothetical protein
MDFVAEYARGRRDFHLEFADSQDMHGAYLAGADLRGCWLQGVDLGEADLSGVNFEGASLEGAYLSGANLSGARLKGANLRGVFLTRASLVGADLSHATAAGAFLDYADLTRANLTGADLLDADLEGANLESADLAAIRDDFECLLSAAPQEAPGLLRALLDGRIDGSVYEGECACLVGTVAKLRGCRWDQMPGIWANTERPIERWALALREGDTPENSPIAEITAVWLQQFLARSLAHETSGFGE